RYAHRTVGLIFTLWQTCPLKPSPLPLAHHSPISKKHVNLQDLSRSHSTMKSRPTPSSASKECGNDGTRVLYRSSSARTRFWSKSRFAAQVQFWRTRSISRMFRTHGGPEFVRGFNDWHSR